MIGLINMCYLLSKIGVGFTKMKADNDMSKTNAISNDDWFYSDYNGCVKSTDGDGVICVGRNENGDKILYDYNNKNVYRNFSEERRNKEREYCEIVNGRNKARREVAKKEKQYKYMKETVVGYLKTESGWRRTSDDLELKCDGLYVKDAKYDLFLDVREDGIAIPDCQFEIMKERNRNIIKLKNISYYAKSIRAIM